jgi:hypothetical protein
MFLNDFLKCDVFLVIQSGEVSFDLFVWIFGLYHRYGMAQLDFLFLQLVIDVVESFGSAISSAILVVYEDDPIYIVALKSNVEIRESPVTDRAFLDYHFRPAALRHVVYGIQIHFIFQKIVESVSEPKIDTGQNDGLGLMGHIPKC